MTISPTIRKYAKGVVAVGTFVLVAAGQLADGHLNVTELYTAAVAALGAVGVIKVANR